MKTGKNMAVEQLLRLSLKLVEIFYFYLNFFQKNPGLFLIYEFQSSYKPKEGDFSNGRGYPIKIHHESLFFSKEVG